MTNFLLLLLFGSFWTFGVHCLFGEGYLLEKAGEWIKKNTPNYLFKPLIGCPPCQASIHGLVIGLIFIGASLYLIPYIVCLCGLNFIIKSWLYPEYE